METVTLGNSGPTVSRLAFGGCPMGGHGWGDVSRQGFIDAVNVALDRGLGFFDTADTYGLGEGERTLGEALGRRRDQAVIATKFGVRVEGGRSFHDNSPTWINKALRSSLKRLGTGYVDLLQLHYRDGVTPLDDVVATLIDLRDQGLIKHFGLSNIGLDDAPEIANAGSQFVSFQNQFSLANRSFETDITALSTAYGLTALTWGSLGQGILTGKYDAASHFGPDDRRSRAAYVNFHGAKLHRNLGIVDVLRGIADDVGKPVAAVAIRWILDRLPNSVAIVGVKTVSQLESNLAAIGWQLSSAHLDALTIISSEEPANEQR